MRGFFAQEIAHGNFGEIGIGDVAVAQDPGEFHRLDFKMAALGAFGFKALEAEMLQDVEGDENREALAIGGNFQNVVTGKAGGDGLDPGCFGCGKILRR